MKERRYRQYLLSVLLVIYAFNAVDRLALGLLLQDIKVDLSLSDTQLGFLTGIAFALFYSVMGIPIARWADRGNRVTIIAITTALWSAAVAFCALAGNFLHLLLIRIGVAVGEAGCVPPAHSLIADYFTRPERPRAVALYKLGVPLASVIGYFLAGWLNEFYGWRMTFVFLGLPGLALAALAWSTLKEPRRTNSLVFATLQPSLKDVWMTLWQNTTFRHITLCFAVMTFLAAGVLQWQPAFFIRSYGMGTGELGTWFSVIAGLTGFVGMYAGAELASRFASDNERLQLTAMAILYSAYGLITPFIYLSPNKYVGLGLIALTSFAASVPWGPLFALIQTLVPERMRAMAIAIIFLFANLIGLGLGPLAAGALSDALRPVFGEESLRYTLLVFCPGYVWGGWHLWRASRTVFHDIEAVHADCGGGDAKIFA